MPVHSLHRLLRHVEQLATLASTDDILAATTHELHALTDAEAVFASCCLPRLDWERGHHTGRDARPISPAQRSALFAVYRKLALAREPIVIRRGEDTQAIFRALESSLDEIHAVPLVHRTGRLWGQLVVIARAPRLEVVVELAQLTMVALENAQRLAFARRDQDRLLLLAEATDDALYDWHFDTRDYWWGGGIQKLLGSDADPVENTARWKLSRIHPEDLDHVRQSYELACENAMTWTCEYRFRRHDGSYIEIEDRGYFLRDVDGRAYRLIGSMRDITKIKSLLAREQQARSEAEMASRAKDEFLAMLGHELRNPLAPIVTGLELLRLRDIPELAKELPVLQRQAGHLIRLVDDLLDISRIAHGKIELKRERFELVEALLVALETARPLVEQRGHALDVDVPATGLQLDADRARLAQAIANVVNNAAKYTEPGGRIAVTARREGDAIVIAVRDNGIGIAPEMLPHVFNMFVQERQALDRAQGGLGLGLSIVRSLIELHGGQVDVASAGQGCGSELTLRLPAAKERRTKPRTHTIPPKRASTGRRIMVVDDNTDAADLLALLLEVRGNTTAVAHDAYGALALVESFKPDLAVLDIGLPEIDGYELAQRLRAGDRELRLVAVTGYGQRSDKEQARAAGFDAHLVKPIEVDALEAVIDRLLPRAEAAAAAGPRP